MLYVAGPDRHGSAEPDEVYGENYRAKDIESSDTQHLRVTTTGGVTPIDPEYTRTEPVAVPNDPAAGDDVTNTRVIGIEELLQDMFARDVSFAEGHVEWAREGKVVNC